jgi:hypothetical protein
MKLEKNVGKMDRMLRVLIALLLLGLAFYMQQSMMIAAILVVLAIVLLATAYTQVCLLYIPFNFKTLEK